MHVTRIVVESFSFDILRDAEGWGWCRSGEEHAITGFSVIGKPVSMSRCKFGTLEKCLADIVEHLSYYHGVRRSVSVPILEGVIVTK